MRPRISVHLMVRDGAAVVARALGPLAGLPAEVCFVDTGSTDGTPDVLVKTCADLGLHSEGVAISPLGRPDLFFRDVPESYASYRVLETTGELLLRDWAAVRNLGLEMCRGDYVLKLDADDEIVGGGFGSVQVSECRDDVRGGAMSSGTARRDLTVQSLVEALDFMDGNPEVDFVASPYEVMVPGTGDVDYVTLYTRLWRNRPHVRFREVCHENVDYLRRPDGSNWSPWRGLLVRDRKDASGASRVPYRNLKVLLHEYARRDEDVTDHVRIHLADEAAGVLPAFALYLVLELRKRSLHKTDQAWVAWIEGRAHEKIGHGGRALSSYDEAARLGWGRAELRAAVLRILKDEASGRAELARLSRAIAVSRQPGRYHPRYAGAAEVRRACDVLRARSLLRIESYGKVGPG